MAIPSIQTAVNAGEISPDLFGRTDLQKYRFGCSTLRNMFASYRGGAFSRAGTAFVGQCKQPGTSSPPILIPFQFSVTQGIVIEAGDNYMRFSINGSYVTEAAENITAITQANPGQITIPGHGYSNGDWVFLSGISGTIQLDGGIYIVVRVDANNITLQSTLTGTPINTTGFGAYISGGTAARIYTLATNYKASDLPLLKWAQSADVMTLVHPSYPPTDLARITNSSWTLTATTFATSISPPGSVTVTPTSTTASNAFTYQYVATAVDRVTGEESVASPIGQATNSVNISIQQGTFNVTCGTVSAAGSYNFYRAPENLGGAPAAGSIFGFVGSALGPSFTDDNITPDFSTSPPLHQNPFAVDSILAIPMTATGSGYTNTASVTISTSTGSGFAGQPIIINGGIFWVWVQNGGQLYAVTDTPVFHDTVGTGASGTLTIGAATGTFPGVVSYFQQRRFYANTNNSPDTYFASQPGAFTNMDSSVPIKDDDAIIGSPWSQQVNGIQWMLNMPGGLVILTGSGAWQLSGTGTGLATGAAITPSNQVAVPQAFNGCSPTIRPIPINYDIIYVQEKGSIVRDLAYNFFVNIYTGTDMTVLSNHLFDGHQILRWDWAEEPFKLIWAVRDDGVLLCLTYLKEQDVYSWSRHDTNGLFQSVASVSEPPVNAAYFVVQRLIQNDGNPTFAYYLERMDNRIWTDISQCWCVDAGLGLQPNSPNATLTISSATGTPTLQQPTVTYGGANYSAQTIANVVDTGGTGSGAIVNLTIVVGAITAAVISGTLTGYATPAISVIDPTGAGAGAVINIAILNIATVTASSPIFTNAAGMGAVGDVIRAGVFDHASQGVMTVTAFVSTSVLTVSITRPITQTIQNDPFNTPYPFTTGEWSIINPVSQIFGLNHLEGMTVSILADGNVVTPQVVSAGSITLPQAASAITIGLGFTAQLQTMYLDIPAPVTIQGRRKIIFNVIARVEATGGPFEIGVNQPDASTQPGRNNVPWSNMTPVSPPFPGQSPLQPFSLFTGDIFSDVFDSLGADKGQVAVQQRNPIPLNVLALVPWSEIQDDAG